MPSGSTAAIFMSLQDLMEAGGAPQSERVPLPWVAPKEVPLMMTRSPGAAGSGLMVVIRGSRVKSMPLLAPAAVVTRTGPVVA